MSADLARATASIEPRRDPERSRHRDRLAALLGVQATWTAALAVAIAVSCVLCLHLTRRTTFGADEYWYFLVNRGFQLKGLLSPHNGHLIAVVRLLYATVIALFGPDYVVFRIIEVVLVALAAGLFYVLARRRVGPPAALALSAPLLFLGSAPDVVLSPNGITVVLCVVFGLAALLALEARTRRGDALACLMLVLAVATFGLGLAFAAAAAVAILLEGDRRRRAYVVLLPLTLYLAWKVGAPKYSGPGYLSAAHLRLANLARVPGFVVSSAAAASAAVSGLNVLFGDPAPGLGAGVLAPYGIGYALAGLGAAALLVRAVGARLRSSILPVVALALAFWMSVELVLDINRYPNSTRYLYAGAISLLLIAAEAMRGLRLRPAALAAMLAASFGAVALNVSELHTDGANVRFVSSAVRSAETAMELARGHVRQNQVPLQVGSLAALIDLGGGVRAYLHAVSHWGSPAYSLAELRRASELDRAYAAIVLADTLGLRLVRSSALGTGCHEVGGQIPIAALRSPGVLLESAHGGPVRLARFGEYASATVGTLTPGETFRLSIPPDRDPDPWLAVLPPGATKICPL